MGITINKNFRKSLKKLIHSQTSGDVSQAMCNVDMTILLPIKTSCIEEVENSNQ